MSPLQVSRFLPRCTHLTEPWVAHLVARELPPGDAMFLGNSMPIRDMDMYAQRRRLLQRGSRQGQKALVETGWLGDNDAKESKVGEGDGAGRSSMSGNGVGLQETGTWQEGEEQGGRGAVRSGNGRGVLGTDQEAVGQALVEVGMGAPVGSNRGASGIDGVLSTAAGFASGLNRAVTLLLGT